MIICYTVPSIWYVTDLIVIFHFGLKKKGKKFTLLLGVGGMSKGFQILLLGILLQQLHHNNTKFWTKNQVLSFLVVSTR